MQSATRRSRPADFPTGPSSRIFIGMDNLVFLNGRYLPLAQAAVSPLDRGFLFADGVYEVVRYYGGTALAMPAHLDRLAYSLGRLRIELPSDAPPFDRISEQLIRRNGLTDASVYWQITRGAAPHRHHAFPDPPVQPTLFAMAHAKPPLDRTGPPARLAAITCPDDRWKHCAIKSVALLPNVLARQAACDAGADEAILVRDSTVTEATARSILIVDKGQLVTAPLDGRILGSITRQIILALARQSGLEVRESYYPLTRLLQADEVIAVGTTTEIAAIVSVNGRTIADGQPGPVTARLWDAFREHVVRECGLADRRHDAHHNTNQCDE